MQHLVSWNCFTKSVCMYICLSFHTHASKPFTWSTKAACVHIIKAKQSLHCTYTQASSASKFLSPSKTGNSNHPQTLKPAFLVNSSGILQGLIGTQEMLILSFEKWAWPFLMRIKMKSIQRLCWKIFQRILWQKDYKTVKKIFLCV